MPLSTRDMSLIASLATSCLKSNSVVITHRIGGYLLLGLLVNFDLDTMVTAAVIGRF